MQEKAYQLLLISKRQQYHLLIAKALEKDFPDLLAAIPEFIAHHYTLGADFLPAIQYWQKAGMLALSKSAYAEAIVLFNKGMSLLVQLQDDEERNTQDFYCFRQHLLYKIQGYTDKGVGCLFARMNL